MSGSASSAVNELGGSEKLRAEIAGIVGSRHEAAWIVEDALAGAQPAPIDAARDMARRRAAGEPLQHILGHWSFRTLDVIVDDRALVPRPETEMVAGVAIDEARRLTMAARPAVPLVIADLGTGSGVIACSLAAELGDSVTIHATDVSPDALALARENVRRNLEGSDRHRVRLGIGSWFDGLPAELAGAVALIVSNPPYLSASEWPLLPPVVRDHDPYGALVAGPDGTEAIFHLLDESARWLTPAGAIVLEIAPHQAHASLERACSLAFSASEVLDDLAGRPRVLVARR